jgi:hypothetical protein
VNDQFTPVERKTTLGGGISLGDFVIGNLLVGFWLLDYDTILVAPVDGVLLALTVSEPFIQIEQRRPRARVMAT